MSIQVHIEWKGHIHLTGRLHLSARGNAVTFEYAPEWLERKDAFSIDPASLPLQRGAQHRANLFGALEDCGPDRWGRIVIERAARKKILPAKPFRDIDYVLALEDKARIGALRFRMNEGDDFLAPDQGRIPPLIRISALLRATSALQKNTETVEDLRFLLGAGSPLGGARPKSLVLLAGDVLALAKFPKPDDRRDIAAGEILALSLARAGGINTADHQLASLPRQNVSVITRFDRTAGHRIPFISGATLLGQLSENSCAYTTLAEGIRQFGATVHGDLKELWRRMVFSLLISNYDDHLRNHGFLMVSAGQWSLSPAYDLNPVPESERAAVNQMAITEEQNIPTIEEAMAAAERFSLNGKEAKQILKKLLSVTQNWKAIGKKLGLDSKELQNYASAFENPLMQEAMRLT